MEGLDNAQLYLGVSSTLCVVCQCPVLIVGIASCVGGWPNQYMYSSVCEAELCPRVQYDFTMEDVPERDPRQVDSATEDTSEILTLLKEEMVCCLLRNYL